MRVNTEDIIPALAYLFSGFLIGFYSVRLGLGNASNPEAGFFAFWIAILIIFLSLIHLAKILIHVYRKQAHFQLNFRDMVRPFCVSCILALYAISFKFLGFPTTTFILIFLLLKSFSGESLIKSFILSLVITFLSYALFVSLLGVPLPPGITSSIFRG